MFGCLLCSRSCSGKRSREEIDGILNILFMIAVFIFLWRIYASFHSAYVPDKTFFNQTVTQIWLLFLTLSLIYIAIDCSFHNKPVLFPTVRPQSVELTGLSRPVLAGTKVTLICTARGAKPLANITWSGWPGTGLPRTAAHTQVSSTRPLGTVEDSSVLSWLIASFEGFSIQFVSCPSQIAVVLPALDLAVVSPSV